MPSAAAAGRRPRPQRRPEPARRRAGGEARAAARERRRLRAKLGLDPTAPDIHLGHTVVLQKLREFQDLGHRVVLIVGDYTARVGDPSGRSSTRPVLSGEEIDANARTYVEQATRVLLDDPERLEVRRNGEWLDMPMEDLFGLARTTTLAQLLERDDFARRHAAAQPISILELPVPPPAGLRLRRGRRRRRARRHGPDRSTCCSGATCSARTGARSRPS
jgi:hypothetical protein